MGDLSTIKIYESAEDLPKLAVNEMFGPTFQGEGQHLGMPCVFLRLAGCNLACDWCDTPYSWDWKKYDKRDEVQLLSVNDVALRLIAYNLKNVVISGGEPMLQQRNLRILTSWLRRHGWFTEIETAGTIMPESLDLVHHFNVSPKLDNSGNAKGKRYNPQALTILNQAQSKTFKFVVSSIDDFDEIDEIVNQLQLSPVYIMPEGITHDEITRNAQEIAEYAIERRYFFTTRLHVSIYGNRRGV